MAISKKFSPSFQAYIDGLDDYQAELDTLIPVLLHTHLFTEHLLERIIRHQLPEPQRLLDGTRVNYSTKLRLAHASGVLPDDLAGALKRLNKLRNDAAHTKGYRIDPKDLEEISRTVLTDDEREDLMKGTGGDRVALGDRILPALFTNLLAVVPNLENMADVDRIRSKIAAWKKGELDLN